MFDFIRGIIYFFNGMALLFRPGLRRFVIIPLVINIVLFVILFGTFQHYMQQLDQWLSQLLPTWLQWMSIFLWALFLLSFYLIVTMLFVLLANMIGAPFYGLLAENVDRLLTSTKRPSTSFLATLADVPRIIVRQLIILLYYLPRAFAMLILFFIPVIQVIMPLLWFCFNAWYTTLTYYDYPSDIHRQPFGVMLASLRRKRTLGFGFGTAALLCSMVPVLNVIAIPAAVAGATQLWLERSDH